MKLVPNAGTVAARASSMWAAYGAIVLYLGDKTIEYLKSPEGAQFGWAQGVLGILLILIPLLRVIQQRSLATAMEQQLQKEMITRQRLEAVATSEGPPISKEQVKSIKKDAAVEAAGVDP